MERFVPIAVGRHSEALNRRRLILHLPDLFLQRHASDEISHSLFDRQIRVQVDRRLGDVRYDGCARKIDLNEVFCLYAGDLRAGGIPEVDCMEFGVADPCLEGDRQRSAQRVTQVLHFARHAQRFSKATGRFENVQVFGELRASAGNVHDPRTTRPMKDLGKINLNGVAALLHPWHCRRQRLAIYLLSENRCVLSSGNGYIRGSLVVLNFS